MNHHYATEKMLVEEHREAADLLTKIQQKILILSSHKDLCSLLFVYPIDCNGVTVYHYIESGGMVYFLQQSKHFTATYIHCRTYTTDDINLYRNGKGRDSMYINVFMYFLAPVSFYTYI